MPDEKRQYNKKSPQEKAQAELDRALAALERARKRSEKAEAEASKADEALTAAEQEVEYKQSHPALQATDGTEATPAEPEPEDGY